jgi:3-oxoacyl-[acyl-carrier-protein] synthase III
MLPRSSCKVLACSGYLPYKQVHNWELAQMVETSDEWIVSRTGIKSRRIADQGQSTFSLAVEAARSAMANAAVQSVDLIILATTTPDHTFPSTASRLQAALEIKGFIPAFDIQAVCCGFIYALDIASKFINGGYKMVLVVCADKMSSIIDWSDRGTCVLFGDGAGAVVLEEGGVFDSFIASDGNFYNALQTTGGPSTSEVVGKIIMDGTVVFRHAVERMSESVLTVLSRNGLTIEDVDWFVPHQANSRIMSSVARNIGINPEKIISTVAEHANCGGASIPLALWTASLSGKLKQGNLVLMSAFGAGFTWGASILRW